VAGGRWTPSGQGTRRRYHPDVAKRDPHDVLGIEPGATPTQIKGAWRRLAREHHPDLTGDDPALSRIATRQMAEINEAYAALTRDRDASGRRASGDRGAGADFGAGPPGANGATGRRAGPPRPRPTRPVTARVDTSHTVRPRNESLRAAEGRTRHDTLPGQAPPRPPLDDREPPRASTPTGPLARSRIRNFRPPKGPPLDQAVDVELTFGKFHGHTLGQVAAFEPSYIDWLAATITRDRDLVAAARVVRDDLDRRGVLRRSRAPLVPEGGARA
jgi:DnaJ-like protein/exodeoxyribonuclease X-like protein